MDSGEEGDGEVVRVQAGPQVSGGVKRSQPVADGSRPLFESGGDQGARLGVAFSELAAERSEGTAALAAGGFGSSAGKGRIGMIDARDVAAVAADIAASPAPDAGETYWLTGPALISYYDVAAVLSKLLGRTITYRELSFDQDKDTMIRAGVPEQIAETNAQAASLTADGDAAWVTDDVPSLLGHPARSFGEFAADYGTAFS